MRRGALATALRAALAFGRFCRRDGSRPQSPSPRTRRTTTRCRIVDALVEAQWGGGADYYPAVVFAVGDDAVSLRYTDGDVEEGVPVNRVRPLPRRRSSAIPSQPAPRPAAKRPRATQPAPKTKKKPRTKKPPPKPPAPEPPAPKRRYDPEEACAICLEPLGDAPQLPGCSHRLHAACVLGPDSLASHAWAENRPSLRRGQQVL